MELTKPNCIWICFFSFVLIISHQIVNNIK